VPFGFANRKGVERSTEVQAASVYEAACRAWANFKACAETEEESYKTTEFVVEVHQEPKVFRVGFWKSCSRGSNLDVNSTPVPNDKLVLARWDLESDTNSHGLARPTWESVPSA